MTDSRFVGYVKIHGKQSWELDALEPQMIADLVRSSIRSIIDDTEWASALSIGKSRAGMRFVLR